MTRSASTDHSTLESRARDSESRARDTHDREQERERARRWAAVRLFGGIVALIAIPVGALALVVIAVNDEPITGRTGASLTACLGAMLGGILIARTCFGAQKAADREAQFMSRIDDDDARLDELFGELAENRNTLMGVLQELAADRAERAELAVLVRQFLDNMKVVGGQSEKARGDVVAILEGQRRILDLLARMDLDRPTREGIAQEIEALRVNLTAVAERLAKEAGAGGYLRQVGERISGVAHLRSVPTVEYP